MTHNLHYLIWSKSYPWKYLEAPEKAVRYHLKKKYSNELYHKISLNYLVVRFRTVFVILSKYFYYFSSWLGQVRHCNVWDLRRRLRLILGRNFSNLFPKIELLSLLLLRFLIHICLFKYLFIREVIQGHLIE